MTTPTTVDTLLPRLVTDAPGLAAVVDGHRDDNDGETLFHVLLGEIADWCEEQLAADPDSGQVRAVLADLADAAVHGDGYVRNALGVSFVEYVEGDEPLWSMLPAPLRDVTD